MKIQLGIFVSMLWLSSVSAQEVHHVAPDYPEAEIPRAQPANSIKFYDHASCGQKGSTLERIENCKGYPGAKGPFLLVNRDSIKTTKLGETRFDPINNVLWGPTVGPPLHEQEFFTHSEAIKFCTNLNRKAVNGIKNANYNEKDRNAYLGSLADNDEIVWSLPNLDNFKKAGLKNSQYDGTKNKTLKNELPGFDPKSSYWSSTADENDEYFSAWTFSAKTGAIIKGYRGSVEPPKNPGERHRVRCVGSIMK